MKKAIIDNAKKATEAWQRLDAESQNKLKKYFHLRPTQTGIMIVSTLSFIPMRRIQVTSENISEAINFLIKNFSQITQVNTTEAKKELTDVNKKFYFDYRKGEKKVREEDIQAYMINNMSRDLNLSCALNRYNYIQFIASELTLEQEKTRVDIVGYDKEDLYLFELKKDRTTKVEQLQNYLDYYRNNREFLAELMQNYPINPVEDFKSIQGCVVMEYCENPDIRKDITKAADECGCKTLFYSHSVMYTTYT